MKLSTFVYNERVSIGVVVTDRTHVAADVIVDLRAAGESRAESGRRQTHPVLSDMRALLEAGAEGIETARSLTAAALDRTQNKPDGHMVIDLSSVRLCAPMPHPRKLFCIAGNYQDHIEEGGAKISVQDTETPRVFMKPPSNTVIGPGQEILLPPVARAVDWEGELAVVIGRTAKGVTAADALDHVAGYTIMNDVSERDLLIRERTDSRPRDKWFDWLNGKWLDTFAPMGPWIVTTDEIADPQNQQISTYVNGERRQHNSTGQMLCPVADLIEYISAFITLEPGDIISTGTVAGVGSTTGTYLKPGDLVRIEISGIGALSNPVAESPR